MFSNRRKLKLTRDTLRTLDNGELRTVVGGLAATVTSGTRPPLTLQNSVCRCAVAAVPTNTCWSFLTC